MQVNKVARLECPQLWPREQSRCCGEHSGAELLHTQQCHTPHCPFSSRKKILHSRIQFKGNSMDYFLSLRLLGAHITCCCCESFCLLNGGLSIITDSNSERLSGWRTFWCSAGCFRTAECCKKFYDGSLLISERTHFTSILIMRLHNGNILYKEPHFVI